MAFLKICRKIPTACHNFSFTYKINETAFCNILNISKRLFWKWFQHFTIKEEDFTRIEKKEYYFRSFADTWWVIQIVIFDIGVNFALSRCKLSERRKCVSEVEVWSEEGQRRQSFQDKRGAYWIKGHFVLTNLRFPLSLDNLFVV